MKKLFIILLLLTSVSFSVSCFAYFPFSESHLIRLWFAALYGILAVSFDLFFGLIRNCRGLK